MRKSQKVVNWVAVVAALTMSAFGQTPKLSPELAGVDQSSNVSVIVQFKQAPGEADHQRVLQGGGQLRKRLGVVKAGA